MGKKTALLVFQALPECQHLSNKLLIYLYFYTMISKGKYLPFSGKVVWITGASSGIGEALSYEFSRLGASLILSSRHTDRLQTVNHQLPSNPGTAKILPIDLEDLEALPQKVKEALSFYPKIDLLINNAALAIRDFALATPLVIDQKLMNINYFAPIVLTKSLLPVMIQNGFGHIVVISSLSGKYGVPQTAAYAASKHALHGFFDTLRSETNHKQIHITLIVPGIIKTRITAHALTGQGANYGKIGTTFQEGYPVDKAARKIIQAILDKKHDAFVGGTEGITLWINRLSPWLLRKIIRAHPIKRWRSFKNLFSFFKIAKP